MESHQMESVTSPIVQPGTYSPISVHMGDTLGVLFLGVLACVLLANWVRAEARVRALTEQIQSKQLQGGYR
jgi:hypothetical protein